MYHLRPARGSDLKAIRSKVTQARLNPFGISWQRFVVAESAQGQIIGCGQVKTHLDGSRELASIVVDPEWRLRGVARAIIEHLIASSPGKLYLTCRSSLGPFYVRFGFRVIEEANMPPYFRLVNRAFRLLQWMTRSQERLLVMKRTDPNQPTKPTG